MGSVVRTVVAAAVAALVGTAGVVGVAVGGAGTLAGVGPVAAGQAASQASTGLARAAADRLASYPVERVDDAGLPVLPAPTSIACEVRVDGAGAPEVTLTVAELGGDRGLGVYEGPTQVSYPVRWSAGAATAHVGGVDVAVGRGGDDGWDATGRLAAERAQSLFLAEAPSRALSRIVAAVAAADGRERATGPAGSVLERASVPVDAIVATRSAGLLERAGFAGALATVSVRTVGGVRAAGFTVSDPRGARLTVVCGDTAGLP